MCTRDTIHHTGCGCRRINSQLSYCALTKHYPHLPCQRTMDRQLEHADRGNRICEKCVNELRRSVKRLYALTKMGEYRHGA